MELKAGSTLQGGKYRIKKVLGKGGFGITYLAYQQGLNRYVAVKEFFMRDYCNREESTCAVSIPSVGSKEVVEKYKSKFVKEAQTIAELDNAHIVPIYDVFEENETAYYVMKHIGGGSLSALVEKGGAMPLDLAMSYVRQVAEALAYCHERNIAHLDVKPGNILIQDGVAVLIDFGISKHYNDSGEQTSSTPVGISKGYAPLEQYKRGGVTTFSPVTDIYSLGAVLYRLVAGQTPPDADEVNEDGLPEFPASIPQYIQDAITAAMQPKKKDRPQSMEELLSLLDDPSEEGQDEDTVVVDREFDTSDSESSGDSSSNLSPRRLSWVWGVLSVIAVAIVSFLFLQRPFEPDDLRSDLFRYTALIALGDSLSMHEESLSEAISAYDSASAYEQKYSGSRYSRRFRGVASSKSASVQSRIDSIRVSDSLAKIAAFEAAAARAELERQEKEREAREREEAERKRNGAYYSNGILRVKGVEYPMVYVSGGSFDMGATSEQGSDVDSDEKPVHRVTLSSYRIGKYEVTQELWEAVMGSNPSYFKGSRRPVECVSWDVCQEFIRKLNALTGQSFRLPTEAEWEYAARGGNSSRGYKYSGSNTIGDVAWYSENIEDQTHNVGTKSPNELGLYDMSGNVSELCSDRYGSYSSSSQSNPHGPSSGSNRVRRGGGWYCNGWGCRVSNRNRNSPDYRGSDLGFRLCL